MNKEKKEICGEELELEKGLYTECQLPKGHKGIHDPDEEKKEIEETLREKFYTEFSIQVNRREDGTLEEFGLDADMADLDIIADFWLKELDSYANKKLDEVREKANNLKAPVDYNKNEQKCFWRGVEEVLSILSNK